MVFISGAMGEETQGNETTTTENTFSSPRLVRRDAENYEGEKFEACSQPKSNQVKGLICYLC